MNARKSQILFFFMLTLFFSRTAFAASWWDNWFNSNQSSTSTSNSSTTPAAAATNPITADPANTAAAQAQFQSDRQQMHDLYQKVWQDRQTGADPTADMQAIQSLQQKMTTDRTQVFADRQALMQHDVDSVQSSRKSLSDTYAKLKQDQAAGADTTADLQALQTAKNTLRADEQKARTDGAGMRGGYGGQYGQQRAWNHNNNWREHRENWNQNAGNNGWNGNAGPNNGWGGGYHHHRGDYR